MKRILSVVLSLCLLLCFPVTVSAEEDLLSHYNGDDKAYLRFLYDYFYEEWGSSDAAVYCAGLEMAKMVNAVHNDLHSHPYLRGTIDPETGEITITGLQVTKFKEDTEADIVVYYNPEQMCNYFDYKTVPAEMVIPDEIDGHPVTEIADSAFNAVDRECLNISNLVIGNNVRTIGSFAFWYQTDLQTVIFGENIQEIGFMAFATCDRLREIKSWGNHLRSIGAGAFEGGLPGENIGLTFPPFPGTLETIGLAAFNYLILPETIIIPQSVQTISSKAFRQGSTKNIVILNNAISILDLNENVPTSLHPEGTPWGFFLDTDRSECCLYCYAGSTAEVFAQESCDPYQLIDGDSLLWDGEAVEGNALTNCVGMTEAELRSHLGIDGTSSEIQIDGLQNGKVVNGTTVTLFHTVAQAPGKVYTVTVERTPGDADGDGTLSLVDVAQLVRYLAGGWNVEVDLSNADVNADGIVNLKDAALLQRYLAGWDVTLK